MRTTHKDCHNSGGPYCVFTTKFSACDNRLCIPTACYSKKKLKNIIRTRDVFTQTCFFASVCGGAGIIYTRADGLQVHHCQVTQDSTGLVSPTTWPWNSEGRIPCHHNPLQVS